MTVGVTEAVVLAAVWAATVVTLTVLTVRDWWQRRRLRWRQHVDLFNGRT